MPSNRSLDRECSLESTLVKEQGVVPSYRAISANTAGARDSTSVFFATLFAAISVRTP
jgi:hypothetical protein